MIPLEDHVVGIAEQEGSSKHLFLAKSSSYARTFNTHLACEESYSIGRACRDMRTEVVVVPW